MKKKIILISLILISLFVITGCNKESSEKYALGDTVKTDIASLKLLAGKYTYAVVSSITDNYGMPKEYDEQEDSRNPYVAAKGHTLASFTFVIENLDRASIDIAESLGSINYNNKSYGNSSEYATVYLAESVDYLNWERITSKNLILLSGEKRYIRAYIDIPVDVDSLDDSMNLTFYLPKSDNSTEPFTFVISKEDRDNYKIEELTDDAAVKNFDKDVVQEYFTKKIDSYTVLNGEEINTTIKGRKFNVTEVDVGSWTGTFTFETSGKIYEGGNKYAVGYANRRSWKISEDTLYLSSITQSNQTNTRPYQVRKISDGRYLLVNENEARGILYIK